MLKVGLFLVLSISFSSSLSMSNHQQKNAGDIATVIETVVKVSQLFWGAYCVDRIPDCGGKMACGYQGSKQCVDPFCNGSSQCPRGFYCNNAEIYGGGTSRGGVCIKNSVFGPMLKGGNSVCWGNSNCPKGFYCNDEEVWGRDGERGNCKSKGK